MKLENEYNLYNSTSKTVKELDFDRSIFRGYVTNGLGKGSNNINYGMTIIMGVYRLCSRK